MPSSTFSSSGGAIAAPLAPPLQPALHGEEPKDGLQHADELEEAHRVVPDRPWGRIALVALALTLVMMAGWELFWRHQGYEPGDIKDTDAAWAEQRRNAEGDAVVLIGSSRNLFDVDLDAWQRTTGRRPIQLSLEGTSPRFALADLASDPRFHGLIVCDVVASTFFGRFGGGGASALAYYQHETPSQRIGRYISILPEEFLAYIDGQTRPGELWNRLNLPLRPGQTPYIEPFKVGVLKADRNARMWAVEAKDEAYRTRQISIWKKMFAPKAGAPSPDPAKVIEEVAANVARIRTRGGRVVFVEHPTAPLLAEIQARAYPRRRYWDALIAGTGAAGVRYDEHSELRGFNFPELSHMDPGQVDTYTERLAPIVMASAGTAAQTRRSSAASRAPGVRDRPPRP